MTSESVADAAFTPLHRWHPTTKGQRLVPVLLACGIQPGQPGDYNITFTVTSSSGLSASVSRRLTIKAACPEGEKLCADQARPAHPILWRACNFGSQAMQFACRLTHAASRRPC